VVEVKRRRVVDVLRILPVRHQADENGHLDASSAMRRAQKRADLLSGQAGFRLGIWRAPDQPPFKRGSSSSRSASPSVLQSP
jgi:hypothetical protein